MQHSKHIRLLFRTLLVCCFAFTAMQVHAQRFFDELYSSETKYHKTGIVNDCLEYYNAPDKSRAKFKKVTVSDYTSVDSTFQDKYLTTKQVVTFNKMGQVMLDVTYNAYDRKNDTTYSYDSLVLKDSTRIMYDAAYNEVRKIQYLKDDSGAVYKINDEIWTYNKDTNLVKDSTYAIATNYRRHITPEQLKNAGVTTDYYKYDKAGNEIAKLEIEETDTVAETWEYDARNDEVYYGRREGEYDFSKKYTVRDKDGYELSETTIEPYDTSVFSWTYDDRHRTTSFRRIHHGMTLETKSWSFKTDGGYVLTIDETPMGDGLSCPNDSRTVTTCDKYDNELSEVVTKEKSGKNFVHTIIHKYVFSGLHIILDSVITTDQGYLYYLAQTLIRTKKYDAHGNIIEETSTGGGEYNYNGSERWKYNEQNNVLEDKSYNSCNTDKPEKSIINIYYPDGKTVAETIEDNAVNTYQGKKVSHYDKDSRKMEERKIYTGYSYQTIYEYEK
jgi:hypothetical protein